MRHLLTPAPLRRRYGVHEIVTVVIQVELLDSLCMLACHCISEMECSFQYTDTCELHIPFPERTEKDFVIYFSPDVGEQRSVVRCEWSDTYICDSEPGFSIDFQDVQKAVITLPSSLETESGKFKWHVLGSDFSNSGGCFWDSKETCIPGDKYEEVSSTGLMRFRTSLKPEYSEYGDNNPATIIGAAVGAAVLICLILLIGIFLWRKSRGRPDQPKIDKSVLNTHGQDDGKISFLDNEKKGSYVDQLQHSGQLAIQISLDEPSCTVTEHRDHKSSDIKDGKVSSCLLSQNPSMSSFMSFTSAKSDTPLIKHPLPTEV
ncbi:uncharacterized protein LOC112569678 isoform X2 [Pomacea canaliculata]|uniref:uncharacterized protein LOC112569678 isoform X2 n=1 Tax=Pomacea canaliculata TaxID=400727 RepID=UPI000D72C1B9|nr:uncharacterized protein LOC112569678 isoform X2 [Pomacea canaliculata]